MWQEKKEKSQWLVKSNRKKPRINGKSGEGTLHRGWEVQRQEQGRGCCPEVWPVFIFPVTNGIPVTAASLWDASCCISHLPTAPTSPQVSEGKGCSSRAAPIPQQVLVELFLGFSVSHCHTRLSCWCHPVAEGVTLDTTASRDKPRHHGGPWGRLLTHSYSEQLLCFTSPGDIAKPLNGPSFLTKNYYFECQVYTPADKLTLLP